MLKYVLQRLVFSIPVFLGVVTIVFLVVRVIPGDPAVAALGDYASKEAVEALRQQMGLNEPLPIQYVRFLGNLVRGELGKSMITASPIRHEVGSRSRLAPRPVPWTFHSLFVFPSDARRRNIGISTRLVT